MYQTYFTLNIILIIINVYASYRLFQKYRISHLKTVLFVLINIIIVMLSNAISLIFIFQMKSASSVVQNQNEIINGLFGVISAYFFVLFVETFRNDHVSGLSFSIISLLTGSVIGSGLAELYLLSKAEMKIYLFLSSIRGFIMFFLFIYVGWLGVSKFKEVIEYSIDKAHKNRLIMLIISSITGYIGMSIIFAFFGYLSDVNNKNYSIETGIIISSLSIISSTLVLFGYVLSPRLYELQPVKLYKLLIISTNGLLLSEHDFVEMSGSGRKMDNILIASAISALRNFTKEIIGEKKELENIVASDHYFTLYVKNKLIFMVLTNNVTRHLKDTLKNFAEWFAINYKENIKKAINSGESIKITKEILSALFGEQQVLTKTSRT